MKVRKFSVLALPAILVGLALLSGCESSQLEQQNEALRQQNLELQNELDAARRSAEMSDAERERWRREAQRYQQELANRPTQVVVEPAPEPVSPPPIAQTGFESIEGIETIQSPGMIKVRVPGDVLFAPGKVDIKGESMKTLNEIASVIQSDYPTQTIRVEGYTDTDPIRKSKWKDNLELSLQRAAAVQRQLESQGISVDRMYSAGFGATHPRGTKAKSRRVEIVVVEYE